MNTITFLYNNKLRIVQPMEVKNGKYGALLVARTRTGKIKSFRLDLIVALTEEQRAVLDGEVALA